MGRLKNLCKFINFSSIFFFFCNTLFQLVLWSVNSSKLLPDNVEHYLTHWHESFNFGAKKHPKNVIGEPHGSYTFTAVFKVWNWFVLDRSFDDILHESVMFSEWTTYCQCIRLVIMSPYTYWITKNISDTCNLNEYTGALMHALVCRRRSKVVYS